MNANLLINIRTFMLGATGVVTLAYAIMALIKQTPAPFAVWVPGAFAVASFITLAVVGLTLGYDRGAAAMDEGYRHDRRRAESLSYWIALWLYPLFGFLLFQRLVSWPVAFAAMGCFTGSVFLLSFVYFDLRGRAWN